MYIGDREVDWNKFILKFQRIHRILFSGKEKPVILKV